MNAKPTICPACGELIIVWPHTDGRTLVIPEHPDRVMPGDACTAGSRMLADITNSDPR